MPKLRIPRSGADGEKPRSLRGESVGVARLGFQLRETVAGAGDVEPVAAEVRGGCEW